MGNSHLTQCFIGRCLSGLPLLGHIASPSSCFLSPITHHPSHAHIFDFGLERLGLKHHYDITYVIQSQGENKQKKQLPGAQADPFGGQNGTTVCDTRFALNAVPTCKNRLCQRITPASYGVAVAGFGTFGSAGLTFSGPVGLAFFCSAGDAISENRQTLLQLLQTPQLSLARTRQ